MQYLVNVKLIFDSDCKCAPKVLKEIKRYLEEHERMTPIFIQPSEMEIKENE